MNTWAQQVFREYDEHSRINFVCDNSHRIMFIRRSNCTTMVGMLTLGVDADWCGADDVRREAITDADTGDWDWLGARALPWICAISAYFSKNLRVH